MIRSHPTLFAFVGFVILTVLFFLPLINQFTTHIAGSGDAFSVLGQPSTLSRDIPFPSPDGFFWLVSNPARIFDSSAHLYLLPLVFGEPVAYNLLWLSSFPLAALGAFLIVKRLTGSIISSFFSGVVYGFSP